MRYTVTIEGREREVDVQVDASDPSTMVVLLDGKPFAGEVRPIAGGVSIRLGGQVFDVMVGSDTPTQLVGAGKRASVSVKSERDRASRTRRGGAVDAKELRAPMPGLIVKVLVEVGAEVELGAPLVVMEAMKMENELRAAGAGVVASIEAREGQNVESGALLVRFE